MIGDDLSALFAAPQPGAALLATYRQGLLTAFNSATGNNAVQVGGSTLTDVPMLLTGSEIGLTAGDRVLLLVLGGTYLIVGKVAIPGGAGYGARSIDAVSWSQYLVGLPALTAATVTTVVTTTVTVPTWANQAIFTSIGNLSLYNTTTDCEIGAGSTFDTYTTGQMAGYGHASTRNNAIGISSGVKSVAPGATITISGEAYSTKAQTASATSSMAISGTVLWRKV